MVTGGESAFFPALLTGSYLPEDCYLPDSAAIMVIFHKLQNFNVFI